MLIHKYRSFNYKVLCTVTFEGLYRQDKIVINWLTVKTPTNIQLPLQRANKKKRARNFFHTIDNLPIENKIKINGTVKIIFKI